MTYIGMLNAFWNYCKTHYVSGQTKLLFYGLLAVFNEANWPESVQLDNYRLMSLVDTKTERVATTARDKLVELGMLKYGKGKKRSPSTYRLIDFTCLKVSESVGEMNSETDGKISSESSSETVRHIKTKTKTKTKNEILSSGKPESSISDCPEQSGSASVPAVIALPTNTGDEFPVTAEHVSEWAGLYPAVDIMQELRKMRGWLLSNPKKRKTAGGMLRFVNGWLAKEQNRGGAAEKTPQRPEWRGFDE